MHKILEEKQSSYVVEVDKQSYQKVWLQMLDEVDETIDNYEVDFGTKGVPAEEILAYLKKINGGTTKKVSQ